MHKITINSFHSTSDNFFFWGNTSDKYRNEKEYDKEKINDMGRNFTSIHEVGYYSFTKTRALPRNVCKVDGDNPKNNI